MDDKDRDIELRSEKIRNIMGQMPPFLIRLNSIVLVVITIALVIVLYKLYV